MLNCEAEVKKDAHKTGKFKNSKLHILTVVTQAKAMNAIIDWFSQETGAIVQITEIGYDETFSKSVQDFHSTDPQFDLYMIWYPELGDMVKKEMLLDLTDWIEKNEKILEPDDFIPAIYNAYTLQNGRRFALPYDGDTHVLFYRKSIFEKYKLNPPKTWDEFAKINKFITQKESINGIYGSAIMCYKVPILLLSSFTNRLGGYGGELLNKNHKPSLNTYQARSALHSLIEHSRYALPSPLETNFEVSRDAFLSGHVAMVEQWTDVGVMAEDGSESSIKGDWGAVQMPKGNSDKNFHTSSLNAGFTIGISSKTKNQELALEFLLFTAKKETMAKYNMLNGGADPTRISVLTSEEYKNFAPQVSDAAKPAITRAITWPTVPGSPLLMKSLTEQIYQALQKRKTPERALEDAQIEWMKILEKEGKK